MVQYQLLSVAGIRNKRRCGKARALLPRAFELGRFGFEGMARGGKEVVSVSGGVLQCRQWSYVRSAGHLFRLAHLRQGVEHDPPARAADSVCFEVSFLMTRRELIQTFGATISAPHLLKAAPAGSIQNLAGTQPLTWDGDLAEKL